VTHSIFGLPVLAALLAALIWGGSRLIVRLTGSAKWRARFGPLLWLSLLAMWTHPLLDFTNAYGWRPFLPWSNRWYYGDIAFVVEIWIWAGLSGALFIVTTRSPRPLTRRLMICLWTALFILTGTAVALFDGAGAGLKLLWFAIAALAVTFKLAVSLSDRQARHLSLGLLATLLVYLGALTILHYAALDKASTMTEALTNEQVTQVSALPMPASPLMWLAIVTTDQAFYLTELRLLGQPPSLGSARRHSRETGDRAAILAAYRTAEAQTFLRFARFPATEVRRHGEQIEVIISDLRFFPASDFSRTRIRLDKNLHPIAEP
jgi:inner membrane protein